MKTVVPPGATGLTLARHQLPAGAAKAWWRAYRHHLRLVRGGWLAWTIVLAGIGSGVIATFEDRYASEADLAAFAAFEDVASFQVLTGRYVQVDTVEGFTLSRWGMFAIGVAVWGMLTGVGLVRGSEDDGHVEPLRSGLITARGLLLAALAAMLTGHVAFAAAIFLSHAAVGLDAATAWALGAAMGLLATAFAAAAALASQVGATRQRAMALAAAVFGLALVLRLVAAAGATPAWTWWTTPFGWIGFLHEVDGARAQVIGALIALSVVLLVPALVLARRDLDAGLITAGSGGRRTARPVRAHAALARHLAAGPTAAWSTMALPLAFVLGMQTGDFAAVVDQIPATAAFLEPLGMVGLTTPEGFLALSFTVFIALLLALFAASQVAAIREEEASWRLEHLLVRPTGRVDWLLTRTATAAVAVAVIALAAAVAAWLGASFTATTLTFGDTILAALNVLPLAWLFLGLGVGLVGVAPRLSASLAYGLVVAAFLIDFVGSFVGLPETALELSPFRHLAAVPFVAIPVGTSLLLLLIGLLGTALGALGFRRRDLQEA